MSKGSPQRKWPVKSFTREELAKFNNSGWSLYLSDPDRIEFSEMLFWRSAKYIPLSIAPNFLTRCGLFANLLIVLLAFGITPAVDGEMGETAQKYVPSVICLAMAVLQFLVCALDSWDGLHARGTNQCSQLGALLDHYFDAITLAMNAVAMSLILNPDRLWNALGVLCGPLIFNMQLLTNYYLKEEPKVAGPEAQMMCFAVIVAIGVMFYVQSFTLMHYICILSCTISTGILVKYIFSFLPMYASHKLTRPILWTQLFIFWGIYAVLFAIYMGEWISTFEYCISSVYVSWDLNGQIVTHHILKEPLPVFKPYCVVIALGVITEYYYFNPLIWMVDSRNNIHLTTLLFWVVFTYKNVKHHVLMADKLVVQDKET